MVLLVSFSRAALRMMAVGGIPDRSGIRVFPDRNKAAHLREMCKNVTKCETKTFSHIYLQSWLMVM